jgi:hypothetical protein
MFIPFQIVKGHVITYNILWIMLPKFDIDNLDLFQGRDLYFRMVEIQ